SMLGRTGGGRPPGAPPPAAEADPSPPSAPDGGGGGEPSTDFSVGKKVFATNCKRCHSIDSEGGGDRGSNLTTVGRDHTADWLADLISKPSAVKPGSRGMPAFGSRLSESELRAVADYLASLK